MGQEHPPNRVANETTLTPHALPRGCYGVIVDDAEGASTERLIGNVKSETQKQERNLDDALPKLLIPYGVDCT